MTESYPVQSEVSDLIPELSLWNDGAGIDPESWICCSGNYELAIGYSFLFWPSFILIDDYVVRQGTTKEDIQEWEHALANEKGMSQEAKRESIEAVLNHIHLTDIHPEDSNPTEAQLRYLGNVLKQIYSVKLQADFPDRRFVVDFSEPPVTELRDYQLTFWQKRKE